ncbi:hypothetical protein Bca4012_001834 [Brassica carinata]
MYQWRFRTQSTKKVIDVKLRKEEARRKKGSKQNESKQISRKSKVVPASDASAKLLASIQKRQGENNQTSMSEKFNPNEDAALKSVMMRGLNWSPPLNFTKEKESTEKISLERIDDYVDEEERNTKNEKKNMWEEEKNVGANIL